MFTSSNIARLYLVLAIVLAASAADHATGQTARMSDTIILSGNRAFGDDTDFAFGGPSSDTGRPVEIMFNRSFEGIDRNGDEQTMTFTGAASASAEFGRLRAAADGTVSNAFFNEDNPPFFDGEEFDEGGVPDFFAPRATASFTDTLQYGGTATGYTSRYLIRLTGNITGEGASVTVELAHSSGGRNVFFFSEPGAYDQTLSSEAFVGGPNQTFSLSLISEFQTSLEIEEDGDTISGSADFGNTLELVAVEVRDEDGNLLSGSQVTSESGTSYDIRAVPEPATLALLAAGVPLVLRRRRV